MKDRWNRWETLQMKQAVLFTTFHLSAPVRWNHFRRQVATK